MKKNDWIYLLSIFAFSILFWKQMPGLNFPLMNLLLICAVAICNVSVLKNRNWWFAVLAAMVSSGSVYLYGDRVSIFTDFAALLLVSAYAIDRENSFFVNLFQSLTNVCATFAYIFVDMIERRQKRLASGAPSSSRTGKRTWIVIGALLVVLVFFFIYRNTSVLFYEFTKDINLDFISLGWCLFTLGGAFLLYGFFHYHNLPGLARWDSSRALTLAPAEKESWLDRLMSMPTEKFSGIVLLVLLNLLLLTVNVLDAVFIFGGKKLPSGVTYTEYVHQGVGLLILSIVMAMLIILYYFRGRLNFDGNAGALRNLALAWIAQNAFMLVSTMFRNDLYIDAYGLTYKRIGVYVYLLLALIGLFTTGWKVIFRKTNVFLIRSNSWLFFAVLVLSCGVNWDKRIAVHNMQHTRQFDGDYIASLSFRVYPELVMYYRDHPGEKMPYGLSENIFVFLSKQKYLREENKWPSRTQAGNDVCEMLKAMPTMNDTLPLDISGRDLKEIYFIPQFAGITSLSLQKNDLVSLGELGKYRGLKTVQLDGNKDLVSLAGIEELGSLEYLSLDDTKVRDYGPLLKLNRLDRLVVDKISNAWKLRLEQRFPGIIIEENSFSIF